MRGASIRGPSVCFLLTCGKMKSCRHEGTQAPSMSSSSSVMLVALDASGSRRRVLRFICAASFLSCLHGCPSLCHHLCQFAAHCGSRSSHLGTAMQGALGVLFGMQAVCEENRVKRHVEQPAPTHPAAFQCSIAVHKLCRIV